MAFTPRWGTPLRMRIAIATIVFVRFANEVSLYQGDSLSFVLLGVVFFGLTSMMLVGFKAQAACTGVAITLMTMHFCMGKVHGYPGWSSHHIYILVVSVCLLALSPWTAFRSCSPGHRRAESRLMPRTGMRRRFRATNLSRC